MIEVKVEKGIPIPVSRKRQTVEWMEVIRKLSPGDSFVVEGKHAYSSPKTAGRAMGYEMTHRLIGPDQWRVWVGKKGPPPPPKK